jgi:4-hydroxybenzoate polyprenyltransferase
LIRTFHRASGAASAVSRNEAKMSAEPRSNSIVASTPDYVGSVMRALRPHNWLKNILLFVPAIVAQALGPSTLSNLCMAFFTFGCVASAHYLINDLRDKDDDRNDLVKRQRPQAARQLLPRIAAGLAMVLIAVAAGCASRLPAGFQLALGAYLFLCLAYSFRLKRVPIIDVLTLTVLYDLRLAAGAGAAMVALPNTLLLACSCFFLTMALLKRMAQLSASKDPLGRLSGRPYSRGSLPALRLLAGATGAASVLACAVLLGDIGSHVARPGMLWFILPLLMAWLGRCLFLADRGKLNEDLVLFVIADLHSNIALSALALLLIAAG